MRQTAAHVTVSQPAALPRTSATRSAEIRQILFPSDLSQGSDRAFEHAALLARRLGARLTLYHAVQSPALACAVDPEDPHFEALRRAEAQARQHLEHRLDRESDDCEVLIGRAAAIEEELLRVIAVRRPDLIVMSTHGRQGLSRLVLGSVTERVVRFAGSPVMCVREPDHGVALPYRRLLVPTDLSEASRRAFPIAAELARSFGADVIALHVAAPPDAAASGTSGISYAVEVGLPSEERLLSFVAPDFEGVRVVPVVEIGSAWDVILAAARVERADLIVMSTHGRGGLAQRMLGSHAGRVVRHACCPVLVV